MKPVINYPSPQRRGMATFATAILVGATLITSAPASFAADEPSTDFEVFQSSDSTDEIMSPVGDAVEQPNGEVLVTAVSAPTANATEAQDAANETSFVVTSLDMGASATDANIGDGACATAAGDCTFLGVLQEVNAAPAGTGPISVTFADSLGAGQIDMSKGYAQRMSTERLSTLSAGTFGTAGAYFEVTAKNPVTIDFGGNITLWANDYDVAGLLVSSPDVTIKNSPNNRAGGASYVTRAANTVFDNLTVSDPGSPILEVGIGIMTGASNVKITNFTANSVWHAGVAVGQGQEVDGLIIDNYTVTNDGGDDTVPVLFSRGISKTVPTTAKNVVVKNSKFNHHGEGGSIYVEGNYTHVDGLTVDNNEFDLSVRGDADVIVRNNSSITDLVFTNNTSSTNQEGIWVYGSAILNGAKISDNTFTGTRGIYYADNYAGSTRNVEISNNIATGINAGSGVIYQRNMTDNFLVKGNEISNTRGNTVMWIEGPSNKVLGVTITENLIENSEGVLIEGIYLSHDVKNGVISKNRFIQTQEWLAENPTHDHNWAIRTAHSKGWSITENHVDGYGTRGSTEGPIRIETYEANHVVGNTFGTRTNGTTDAAKSEAGANWFLWNVGATNNSLQTLRPENAKFDGSKVSFTAAQVDPVVPGNKHQAGPYTVHVYWTAGEHAEEYLGAVKNVTAGRTISVPTTHESGFIRVQTVAQTSGDVSQYSGITEISRGLVSIFGATCDAPTAFATNNEGWRAATTKDGKTVVLPAAPTGWSNTQGLPPGSITSEDLDGNWTEIWTPKFDVDNNIYLTDYADLYGKTISFNYLAVGADTDLYFSVFGANGYHYWYVFEDQVKVNEWSLIEVPLDVTAPGWHIDFNNNTGPVGAAPTEAQLVNALKDVYRFTISAEGKTGPDQTWVDNFGIACDEPTPDAPVIDEVTDEGLSGTGQADAVVTVRDSKGNVVDTATVDEDGNWIILGELPCGETLTATQRTEGSAESEISEPYVTQECPVAPERPAAPVITDATDTTVSGTGEPGATVIVTDAAGEEVGTTTVNEDGNWVITTEVACGETFTATQRTDEGGESSLSRPFHTDECAVAPPAAPVIDNATDTTVSGTGEPGAVVTVRDSNGNVIGEATVDSDGNWIITGDLPCGEVLTATQRIEGGAESEISDKYTTTECATPEVPVNPATPEAPVIKDATDTTVSGTGEPGAVVTVRDATGKVVGSATVSADGSWAIKGSIACAAVLAATQQIDDGEPSPAGKPFTVSDCADEPGDKPDTEMPVTGTSGVFAVAGGALALAVFGGLAFFTARRRSVS